MNQHSQIVQDHHRRILDAAWRCFVRAGFHRATMQDVAAEASMSAGNIYRYFPSKDAIVSGICERDRAALASCFASLESDADPLGAFMAIARLHLVEEPRENAIFTLDLWAEAARNPHVSAICDAFEVDIRDWIGRFVARLKAHGDAHPDLDVSALVDLLVSIADGLLARRARDPRFNPAGHLDHLESVLRLACAGAIASLLRKAPSSSEPA